MWLSARTPEDLLFLMDTIPIHNQSPCCRVFVSPLGAHLMSWDQGNPPHGETWPCLRFWTPISGFFHVQKFKCSTVFIISKAFLFQLEWLHKVGWSVGFFFDCERNRFRNCILNRITHTLVRYLVLNNKTKISNEVAKHNWHFWHKKHLCYLYNFDNLTLPLNLTHLTT